MRFSVSNCVLDGSDGTPPCRDGGNDPEAEQGAARGQGARGSEGLGRVAREALAPGDPGPGRVDGGGADAPPRGSESRCVVKGVGDELGREREPDEKEAEEA